MAEKASNEIKKVAEATKEVTKEVKSLKEQQEELLGKMKKSTQGYENLKKAMLSYSNMSTLNIDKIIQQTASLNVNTQKLAQLNKEGYEFLTQKHQKEVEGNDKQIESLAKNIKKQKELLEAYKKRSLLIVETAELSKAQVRDEYQQLEESLQKNADYELNLFRLVEERNEKIATIEKETREKVAQNAADMQMELEMKSKDSIDQIVAHAGEVVKHTSGAWEGVIDVGAQKEHLETAKAQYTEYLEQLKAFGIARMTEYNKQIGNQRLSVEENDKLIAERNAFSEKHNKLLAEETKRIGKEIEKTEKASQDLRLQQFNEYVGKYQGLNSKISQATKAASDAFGQLSKSYTEEAAAITQKIADNETERQAAKEDYEANKVEYQLKENEINKKVKEEEEKLKQATTEEDKRISQEKINNLKSEIVNESTIKAEYDKNKEKLENDKRKKEKKAKQVEKIQKKIDLAQQINTAIGDIAAGTTKALAHGPILGPILATIVAAAGAMQIGIMTKQLAKFEDGGLLSGKRHREGGMRIEGTNIEVEGGEYVVNRDSTRKNMGLIRYINSQRRELDGDDLHNFFNQPSHLSPFAMPTFSALMEQGGQVPMMPTEVDISNSDLLNSIQNMKIEPRVAVTDIHSVQGQMAQVDEWVGM